jgi:CO/xanthine dehydrogenase Mo-binding subunit
MHTSLLETQDKQGPYGFKGFGDLPAIGVAPAIFNAVANAIGQRLYELPLFPERLFSLIRRKS